MEKWSGHAGHRRVFGYRSALMLLAGLLLILAVNLVTQQLVDNNRYKMGANHILSPWDKSAAPPPLAQPSRIVAKPNSAEPD